MEDIEEDFINFHDEIIFENIKLKAKLEALEELVNSSLFLLFDKVDYRKLMMENFSKQANVFDDLSSKTKVYNARNLSL